MKKKKHNYRIRWIGLILTILIILITINIAFKDNVLIQKIEQGRAFTLKEETRSQSMEAITEEGVLGKIYFNKPVSWEYPHVYIYNDSIEPIEEPFGEWPGIELTQEEDYIYYFTIEDGIVSNEEELNNFKINFNNGWHSDNDELNYVLADVEFEGFDKIYNVTSGLTTSSRNNTGEWIDYSEDLKIGKIPTTTESIKNVIYMIGDGMGENHIKAGSIYKGEELNIQKIGNSSYITTSSTERTTDSAAAATALATGYKTNNGVVGKDRYGNNVENLTEYSSNRGLKTGIVVTQIINHATPAGFSVHNIDRNNYSEIALAQVQSGIDLLLGGGRTQFSAYEAEMQENGYTWINSFTDMSSVDNDKKIIGTFSDSVIGTKVSLSEMTEEALSRLENDNGFFLMVEGSCIDTYSHDSNMSAMLTEMIGFDDAVGVAMQYVDQHPDTLLIVTADHETGRTYSRWSDFCRTIK